MSEWRHYDRWRTGGDIDWPSVDRHAKPTRRPAQPKPTGPTTYHRVACVTTLPSGRVCGAVTIEAMQSITLKVGQSSVVIDQTGVTVEQERRVDKLSNSRTAVVQLRLGNSKK